MKIIFDKITQLKMKREIRRFFSMTDSERTAEIRRLYAHETIKDRFETFFEVDYDFYSNAQFFFDVCVGYGQVLPGHVFRQIGCFALTECRFMAKAGFQGTLQATDFDERRLAFLSTIQSKIGCGGVALAKQDLEDTKSGDFVGVDVVMCQAVLSNLQPNNVRAIFDTMMDDGVKLVLIGDIYNKQSLNIDIGIKSIPSEFERNWFHPYLSFAAQVGFEALFFPDFVYSSYTTARGIFIAVRPEIAIDHSNAMNSAVIHYWKRQQSILSLYSNVDINSPMKFKKR